MREAALWPNVLWAKIPRGRLRNMIATVAVVTVTVAGAALIPNDTVPTPPPSPAGVDIWVATNGNDSTCVKGNQALPCATFNKAVSLASCGDEVMVLNGSYGLQSLQTTAPGACSESNPVYVTGQTQSGVVVTRLEVADPNGTGVEANRPGYYEISDMTVSNTVIAYYGKMIVRNIDGGYLYNAHADTRSYDNDWGPCYTGSGGPNCGGGQPNTKFDSPRSIIVDGDTWHDFLISDDTPDAHFECIQWFGMGTGTAIIRNSHFYNCVTYAIYFTSLGQAYTGDILIENNWFGRACNNLCNNEPVTNRSSAIFTGTVSNLLIRFNSFVDGSRIMTEGSSGTPPGTNVRVVGNIIGYYDGPNSCQAGIQYSYNALKGGTCGATDISISEMPYVNTTSGANGDYHLSSGLKTVENLVPPGATDSDLTVDRDGDARPQDTNRDAGADER